MPTFLEMALSTTMCPRNMALPAIATPLSMDELFWWTRAAIRGRCRQRVEPLLISLRSPINFSGGWRCSLRLICANASHRIEH